MPSDQEYLQSAGITDTETNQTPETATAPTAQPTETPTTAEAQTQPTPEQAEMFELMGNKFPVSAEFAFHHGGKMLKVPYNKLVNTYRQAAHMQDKWGEFKKLHSSFEQEKKDYEKYKGFYDKYGQFQEWSEKNPDQWSALYDLYQNKDKHLLNKQVQGQQQQQPGSPEQQGQQQSPYNLEPLVNEITGLKSQLSKYDQMLQEMEQRKAEEVETKNVDFVKNEVKTFSKEFPEIDVTETDPDGIPLWSKIADWGNENGFKEFTPAAYMYLKQRIAETYQSRARSEAMKSVKQDHKEGIVKRSATPIQNGQGQATHQNLKKMSYAELADLAKGGHFATGT